MTGSCQRRQWLRTLGGVVLTAPCLPGQAFFGAPTWPELKADIRKRYPGVPQLSVAALRAWQHDSSRAPPLLLDVRPPEEFNDGHIEGALRVGSALDALPLLRGRQAGVGAVLYCSVGHRSSELAQALISRGVPSLFNLEGSLFEWANDGHPVVANHGPNGKVHPYNRKWGVLLRRELWSREP